MGSTTNPKTWIPYGYPRDCSQGFCSVYCPQLCYVIFPPPPPPPFDAPDDDDSGPNFSPLVIAIIGILASAFLLVSYYAIISKYCKNRESTSRRQGHVPQGMDLEENQDPSVHHGHWQVPTNGLDERLIKSITMFKYKKGDGLFDGSDCSVCLGEFQEDECLRLLPKCSHAFHVTCIDAWLKSHANCPLCRANVVFFNALPREAPPLDMEPASPANEISVQTRPDDIEIGVREQDSGQSDAPVQVSESGVRQRDIRAVEDQQVVRSVSMDDRCQGRSSIADTLSRSDNEDDQIGPSKDEAGDMSSMSSNRNTRPISMKRSFSGGRFVFSNHGRCRSTVIPL